MPAEYRARIEAHRPQLHKTARETYGVEMNPGPFGLQSRPALIGAKVAEAHGRGAEFHARVMRAYWEEHQIAPDSRHAIRHLTQETGADRNRLFELFPFGYVQQACKIAGMKRPRAWSTG